MRAASLPPAFIAAASAACAACALAPLQAWSPCSGQAPIWRPAAYSSHLHSYSSASALVSIRFAAVFGGTTADRRLASALSAALPPTAETHKPFVLYCRRPSQRSCHLIGVCCRPQPRKLIGASCRLRSLPQLPLSQFAASCGRISSGYHSTSSD